MSVDLTAVGSGISVPIARSACMGRREDAVSRIYDMEPIEPSFQEEQMANEIMEKTYVDA